MKIDKGGSGDQPQRRTRTLTHSRPRAVWRRARGLALVGLLGLGGCTDAAGYDVDILLGRIPFLSTLRWDVAYHPYEMPRLPADGSIPAVNPRGDAPEAFTQSELTTVAAALPNPLEPTADVLVRGQRLYAQHCYACHGPDGAGDGPVVGPGRFPFAPRTDAAAVAQYTDGYLYGIVRVGRGLMPAYGDRMTHLDRWALVHYLRTLGTGQPGVTVPAAAPITAADPAVPDAPPPVAPQVQPDQPGQLQQQMEPQQPEQPQEPEQPVNEAGTR